MSWDRLPEKFLELPLGAESMALSHDGSLLALGQPGANEGPRIAVCDSRSGSPIAQFAHGAGSVKGLAFGPSQELCSLVEEKGQVRLNLHELTADGVGATRCLATYERDQARALHVDEGSRVAAISGFDAVEFRVLGTGNRLCNVAGAAPPRKKRSPSRPERHPVGVAMPSGGGTAYLHSVVPGKLLRWDLQRDVEVARWDVPTTFGAHLSVSRSGRYALLQDLHGPYGGVLDTETGSWILEEWSTMLDKGQFSHDETLVFCGRAAFRLKDSSIIQAPETVPSGHVWTVAVAAEAPVFAVSFARDFNVAVFHLTNS